MNISSYAKGIMGETAARDYLSSLGMEPLDRRYRGGRGEIDLIMQDGEILVFVEVKARSRGGAETAAAGVTPGKQRRLSEAACCYLSEHPEYEGRMLRFDVVTLTGDGIHHFPNAFELCLP